MPIEQRSRERQVRAILIGVVSLIFAVTLGYALFQAAFGARDSVATQSGGRTFVVGSADRLSRQIEDGGPILLPDPSAAGQLRPIFVYHDPDDAETDNWVAYEARPPGADDDCFLTFDRESEVLEADCVETTFDAGGAGLTPVPVEVDDDGRVILDLAEPDDSAADDGAGD